MTDQRLPVLLLAIALLGVAEVSSTSSTYNSYCSFTNMIPDSSGAYITLSQDSAGVYSWSENWARSMPAAFGETVYFTCSNASIVNKTSYANVWDDATGVRIVSTVEQTQKFSCQARNHMIVYPSTYGSSSAQIGRFKTLLNMPADTCEITLANYGYNGTAHFMVEINGTWAYVAPLPYGAGGILPGYCNESGRWMAVEDSWNSTIQLTTGPTVLALSLYSSYHDDTETNSHYLLGGESGSNVMKRVGGCGNENSDCRCALDVSSTDTQTFTCQDIKTAYKFQSCCHNPQNPFTVPISDSRRQQSIAPSDTTIGLPSNPQVVDQVLEEFTNWNTLLNKGLISAEEYSTRRTRLLESLA